MNIILRELKTNRRSLLFWCLGMIMMIAGGIAKYAASLNAGQSMDAILDQMPPALQVIFGVGLLDFSKASSFYAVLFLYLLLIAAIHASMLGAGIISHEERDRTSEFLFVKPRTRAEIITAKLLSALVQIVILNLVTWAVSAAMVNQYSDGMDLNGGITKLMLCMLLVQLTYLSMGAAAAGVLKNPKAAVGVATGVMLATFLLYIAIDVGNNLDWMKPFTPFAYFDAKQIFALGQGIEWVYPVICAGATAVFTAATYVFFKRRDLKV